MTNLSALSLSSQPCGWGIANPWASISLSSSRFHLRLLTRSELKFATFSEGPKSDLNSDGGRNQNSKLKPDRRSKPRKSEPTKNKDEETVRHFPPMVPKSRRRGRKSEEAAVQDHVRNTLSQTLSSIREHNPEILENIEKNVKENIENHASSDEDSDSDEEEESSSGKQEMLLEEEDPSWPLDADVGWGIRASEYFEQHPIKNIVGKDGSEIDWMGEIDDGLVKEINCLEWESFAFHPSPLIVLVFERYNRASDNWKVLKELEKAATVYWKAKDRLPPRTIKIDMNIERDLAYALKVKECPQILFLRGNKILHREKEFRSEDELVQMIAHFYYNAKRPSYITNG